MVYCWLVLIAMAGGLAGQTQVDYPRDVKRKPFEDVREYEFNLYSRHYTVTSGTSLATTGAKTITMLSPYKCPKGLWASNTFHKLRIMDGTGTDETVTVTGGTCTGTGSGTGTISFTTSNTHTGAFRITSATAFAQEAILGATTNQTTRGMVWIPAGNHIWYAGVSFYPVSMAAALTVQGAGQNTTMIIYSATSGNAFSFPLVGSYSDPVPTSHEVMLRDFTVYTEIHTSGWGVEAHNQSRMKIINVNLTSMANGVKLYHCEKTFINSLQVVGTNRTNGIGLLNDGVGPGRAETTIVASSFWSARLPGDTNIAVVWSTGGAFRMYNSLTWGFKYGIYINPGDGQYAHWGSFVGTDGGDTNLGSAVVIAPIHANGQVKGIKFSSFWVASSTEEGMRIDSTLGKINGIYIGGGTQIYDNAKEGIVIAGAGTSNIELDGVRVCGNSSSATNTYDGIVVTSGPTHVTIRGGASGSCDSFDSTTTPSITHQQRYGVAVGGTVDYYWIGGGMDLSGNATGPIADAGTGVNKSINGLIPSTADIYPTSCAGLPAKTKWNDSNTLKLCP